MFSFLGKKGTRQNVSDVVFTNREAKWNALLQAFKQNTSLIFVAWFENSLEKLQQFFTEHQQEAPVITYRQVHSGLVGNKQIIFIEHYPLKEKEQQVFASIHNDIKIYSSLDEAFFKHFGGDKISSLMEKMGLAENEPISHTMITKAIENAQEKLSKHIIIEQPAFSMEEWLQKNIPADH